MGFQADDPTDPAEIGKAAKRFFSEGSVQLVERKQRLNARYYLQLITMLLPGLLIRKGKGKPGNVFLSVALSRVSTHKSWRDKG